MSQSPDISFINGSETTGKKRKINYNTAFAMDMSAQSETPSQGSGHVPKRGARACTNCRRGKNRCEGEPPCKRCQQSGTPCIFEKPDKKHVQGLSNGGLERLARLEGQYLVLQSQMIGMQTTLDRIMQAIQTNPSFSMPPPPPIYPPMEVSRDSIAAQHLRPGFDPATAAGPADRARMFHVPGFPPAAHKFPNFGMVPTAAASSEEETDEALPRGSVNTPIEALHGLANAAVEAAAAPSSDAPRLKKRKRTETSAKNTFPHVADKGLVTESEARELFNIFFAGCHLFIPIFDPSYDTYESLMERSPWTFNAILTVAAKIRSGNGPLTPTFHHCQKLFDLPKIQWTCYADSSEPKDAAVRIQSTSSEYCAALLYAVQDTLVMAAFSGFFLLKMAYLFPTEIDLGLASTQAEQLAQLLSDVAAERCAMTLQVMLAIIRRKVGIQ